MFNTINKIVKHRKYLFDIFTKFRVEESYIEFFKFYFLRQRYRFTNIKVKLPYLTIHTLDGKFKCPITDNWDAIYSIDPLIEFALREEFIIKNESVVFFDVGAYIGRYSIMLGNMKKNGEIDYDVHGFEPSPTSYELFEHNVKFNKLENDIHIYNLAFSNYTGIVTFGKYYSGSKIVLDKNDIKDDEPDYEYIDVDASIGDDFFTKQNIVLKNKYLLMKIDVEGHELEVLNGLSHTLNNSEKGKLIIEILPNSEQKDDIYKLLSSFGYSFRYLKSGHNFIFMKD